MSRLSCSAKRLDVRLRFMTSAVSHKEARARSTGGGVPRTRG